MKFLTYLFILTLAISACQPKYLSQEELVTYINEPENGLIQTKERGKLTFSVVYRPTDMLVMQEVDNPQDTAAVSFAREKYQKYLYFVLQMSNDGKELLGSSPEYSVADYISTISFGMQPLTRLTTLKMDTIEVADYIYSRTFGYGTSTDLLFVFEKDEALAAEKFYFNVDEFGLGVGNLQFEFNTQDLINIPQLKELQNL